VSAKDKATSKEQKITIQASGGLTEEEIRQMVRDAEANAAADKERREAVETKNQAESLLHTTEKQLAEHGAAIGPGVKGEIEAAMASLKTALEGQDTADIKAKSQALALAAMKMGEAIYAKEGEGGDDGPSKGRSASPADDEVVDADFEEVDEGKKSA
ncbi:MAG: molecular chaperone DnaK, partial [Gammaproteobacteria bacterium]|nr:molecular chaperone DnaK [Gammaproteobacteria bacterium]